MKKLFSTLLLAAALLLQVNAYAQTDSVKNSLFKQSAVQLNLGTQGIGAEFVHGVGKAFALRAGATFINVKRSNIFEISDFNSTTEVTAKVNNLHLLADYAPFNNALGFRLVGGLAYFYKASGNLRITPEDNYTYGDIQLSKDQVGYLDMHVDWKGIAPYFGLAFGKAIPGKGFNLSVDLGAYNLKSPDATIIGTGVLEGNNSQSGQLKQNLKDYKWLPVVQFNLNFKL